MPETYCIVPECKKSGHHILPTNKQRRDSWIQAIRRGKNIRAKWSPPSKFCYICRNHFVDDDYIAVTYHGTIPERRTLKKTAVPSVFAWKAVKPDTAERSTRYVARAAKRRKLFVDSMLQENKENLGGVEIIPEHDTCVNELNLGSCIEITNETFSLDTSVSEDNNTSDEIRKNFASVPTQTPFQRMYSIENFRNDNEAVHFYTGVENILKFYFVLRTLGPAAYCLNYVYHQVVSVDVPDQFFMVLMKLRRQTTNFELARMFGMSETAVLNIVITWIKFMALQWKELNLWPPKELVKYFAPSGFRTSFPSTRVIIDGTECPIKKPKKSLNSRHSLLTKIEILLKF